MGAQASCKQVRPSPAKPASPVQLKAPSVLAHVAWMSQSSVPEAHSSMSLQVCGAPSLLVHSQKVGSPQSPLLVAHSSMSLQVAPTYPVPAQSQTNPACWSVQTPPFLHGALAQAE